MTHLGFVVPFFVKSKVPVSIGSSGILVEKKSCNCSDTEHLYRKYILSSDQSNRVYMQTVFLSWRLIDVDLCVTFCLDKGVNKTGEETDFKFLLRPLLNVPFIVYLLSKLHIIKYSFNSIVYFSSVFSTSQCPTVVKPFKIKILWCHKWQNMY